MNLTVAYLTARQEPHIDWFWESLLRQCDGNLPRVVVVDFHRDERDVEKGIWRRIRQDAVHVTPKPTVWQGKHRLTKENWFAASNARNTALCLAPDGWIAYVDDLSVLLPGWLDRVKAAMDGRYIAFGAYRKVRELVVQNGEVKSFTESPGGMDCRMKFAHGDLMTCGGDWLYGCSLAAPVEAFLEINGWAEWLDGMGYEDTNAGITIGNTGHYSFRYDKRMMTYESEEGHSQGVPMRREDPGRSPNDKSHAAVNIAKASKFYPNYFGAGGIRSLRQRILAGEEFPVMGIPEHEWFTARRLADL